MLAYHSVGTDARPAFRRWQVSASLLDEQFSALTGAGLSLHSVSTVLGGTDPAAVAFSFDDGFADFLTALPVVERHARSATLYVPTGLLGSAARWLAPEGEDRRRLLTWEQLRDLPDSVQVGSHSRTHLPLDAVTAPVLEAEVTGSRHDLEDRLGRAAQSFAYPFGFHDRRVRSAVRAAGYGSACEVGYRRHRRDRPPLAVSRLLVTSRVSPDDLLRLVTGRARQVRSLSRPARPLHRAIRRARTRVGGA